MTRTLIVIAAALTLSVPAALAAPPAGKGKPESPGSSVTAHGHTAGENAAKKCKAERGTSPTSIAAFKEKYGTNANKSNAFGKCVSATVDNAAKKCKALKKTDPTGFATLYGSKPNAYGKCVSALAKPPSS